MLSSANIPTLALSSVSYPEHFSYSHGEYGSLHAKSLQQQNLVSILTHFCMILDIYMCVSCEFIFFEKPSLFTSIQVCDRAL